MMFVLAACDSDANATDPSMTSTLPSTTMNESELSDSHFPDIVGVVITPSSGSYRFDVTMSSPYDTPDRYADAWRIVGPDGAVYGVRELLHDHQFEQPFTRSLSGVSIPPGVQTVTVEGRDQVNGWGGETFEVAVPAAGS